MSFESLPADRERNNFNLLRLVAASAVIVSHAYGIAVAPDAIDPLQAVIGFDLGTTAVIAFFAISGYFVSLSFDRRRSNLGFIVARITRVIPALLVVSLISAFVLGPLLTVLPAPAYFADKAVWLYPLQNISIVRIMSGHLPGLFVHNPIPGVVNASLWTLFYEVACYGGLFLAGCLGFLQRRRVFFLIAAWVPLYLAVRYGPLGYFHYFAVLSLPFIVGMALYQFRGSAIVNGWVALLLFVAATGLALMGYGIEELWSLSTGYGVIWLGFAGGATAHAYNRVGDFSYGTYIYGFPVEQSLTQLMPGISPLMLTALALPISILLGALSWNLVEKPALQLRRLVSRRGQVAGEVAVAEA